MIKTAFLLLTLTLEVNTYTQPTIERIKDNIYLVKNPLDYKADIKITCGHKYFALHLTVDANKTVETKIKGLLKKNVDCYVYDFWQNGLK